jgi:integrase
VWRAMAHFRKHTKKNGETVYYWRGKIPVRCENGSLGWRDVERSTGTSVLARAKAKARLFEAEYHEKVTRAAPSGGITFAEAATTYMKSGGSPRFLAPILQSIGLQPVASIDQEMMLELAKKLYPAASASTLNRQLWTPVMAVANHAAKRQKCPPRILERPRGHDALPIVDTSTLPDRDWFDVVLPLLSPSKRALLLLLTLHGLRLGEAIGRTPLDLDQQRWTLMVPDTKTGEPFFVHLCEPVIDALRAMLADHKEQNERMRAKRRTPAPWRWLFGTNSRTNVARDIRQACDKAKVRRFGTHRAGRHSFANRVLQRGHSLPFLKEAGRWATLSAVQRYAHLSRSEVQEGVRQIGKDWREHRKSGNVYCRLQEESQGEETGTTD